MRKAAILACFDGKQKLSAVCHIMCGFHLKHCRIMDFFTAWFETPWLYAAYIALPACLLSCAKPALKAWRQNPQAFGVLLCFFAVFWSLGAGLDGGQLGGLRYHLLGVTLGSLMIGSAAAFWLAALFMLPHMLLTVGAQNLAASAASGVRGSPAGPGLNPSIRLQPGPLNPAPTWPPGGAAPNLIWQSVTVFRRSSHDLNDR